MAGKKFSIEAIFSAVDKISAPIARIGARLGSVGKGASSALKGANRAVDKGIAGVGKFGSALGVASAVSVAGLGVALKDTIEQGADFERTMVFAAAQFPGMIKQGTKEFDALQAAARKVGDETEFSSQQAAEGLTLLATAGLSVEQAIGALPKVVNFATASKVEFAKASDIANNVMGAFSLTSKDATKNAANMSRVMDVLTRAAADSTTNVEELFEAVSSGGNIAKTAGISLETFIGYTEALANTGIKGAEAGTAIRNVFLELGSPTTAAAKGMAALGVKVARTKKGAIDMTTTIARFTKATEKMSAAEKIAALGRVFGRQTVGPFIALMDAGVDTIEGYRKSLEGASGTTEGMAKLLSADMLGALRNFSSLIDGVKLDVFEAIRPVLMDLIKATSDWVTQNRELIKTKAGEWITMLRDNLPFIAENLERIAKALAAFAAFAAAVKTINAIASVVGFLSAAWGVLSAVVGFFALQAIYIAPLIAGLGGPILLIGAAVAAVVALVWAFWPEISSFFSKLADWIIAAWQRFSTATVAIFEKFKAYVVGVVEFAVGVFMVLFGPLINFFGMLWEGIKAIVRASFEWHVQKAVALYQRLVSIFEPVLAFFASLWDGVKNLVVASFELQYAAIVKIFSPLGAFFEGLWKAVVVAFDFIVGPVFKTIGGWIDRVRAIGRGALGTEAPTPTLGEGAAPPQIVSPQERAAAEAAEANANASVNGEILVSPAPGATASVMSSGTLPLSLASSGAFP